MQDLTSDSGVFIRSMATRGAIGGLSATTGDVVTVLDAAGNDIIIVETVGAGQDEVDIADTAHTTVVINVRGGDDMQAMKAGILEIADILVVNKADNPGADATFKQLHIYTDLQRNEGWDVPILKTVAHKEQGIKELLEAIDRHREYLTESGRMGEMTRKRARRQLLAVAQQMMLERVSTARAGSGLRSWWKDRVRRSTHWRRSG
jgi:LAO/AO transport system kinase